MGRDTPKGMGGEILFALFALPSDMRMRPTLYMSPRLPPLPGDSGYILGISLQDNTDLT